MRVLLWVILPALLFLLGCSDSGFDTTPQILFGDISGLYAADVNQRGLGRLAMTLERVEETRTVYTAEMTNIVGDEEIMLEAIGTLTDDHLILNFDRGVDSDFYFESQVEEMVDGFIELDGRFIFPDFEETLPAVFSQPLSGS
jgi:hypothetical protein